MSTQESRKATLSVWQAVVTEDKLKAYRVVTDMLCLPMLSCLLCVTNIKL